MATRRVDLKEVFANDSIAPIQIWTFALCLCVIFLDGFDLVLIGVTLPKIAKFLNVGMGALGLAVGASLMGPLIGALVSGMLADRFGRKKMLVLSALCIGIFTLATTQVTNIGELTLFRFLTGVGLGGAVPNVLAFACEYAPVHKRNTFTTLMWAGMALGSIPVGFMAAWLLPHHGWQVLFWIGGVPPLAIAVVVALTMPESLAFLVRKGKDKAQIHKIVAKISPALAADDTEFYLTEAKLPGVPVKHLFMEGRAFTTVCLWILFFMAYYLAWIMLAWAPTLLIKSGATPQQAGNAFAIIGVGSVIASISIGRLMDRFDPFLCVAIGYVLAFFAMGLFGATGKGPFIVVATVAFICGLFVFGTSSGTMALGTLAYPVDIRGTGVGWAYAAGKVGSMFAPMVVGFLLSRNWSVVHICFGAGSAGLIAAIDVLVLRWHIARSKAASEANVAAPEAALS